MLRSNHFPAARLPSSPGPARARRAARALPLLAALGAATLWLAPSTASAQSCSAGQRLCDGNYCIPDSGTCCGYGNGTYCASQYPVCCGAGTGQCGATSSDCSGGSGGGGGGGSCDPGYYQCGENHCAPNDSVCCASVGREDISCPSGTTCNSDGTCSGGGSGSGGGTCSDPNFPYNCGDGYCYSEPCEGSGSGGGTCSDPDYPYNCGDGYCYSQPCEGSGSGSAGGTGTVCSSAGLSHEGCESIEACCDPNLDCYYVTDDGSTFYCLGSDCTSAAEDVVAYCEDQSGCNASPAARRASVTPYAAVALLGLLAAVRAGRRRRRPS